MKLLIIVTGSIAISKLPEIIKLLSKKKIKIDFIFTKSALSIMKSKQLLYLKNSFIIECMNFQKPIFIGCSVIT